MLLNFVCPTHTLCENVLNNYSMIRDFNCREMRKPWYDLASWNTVLFICLNIKYHIDNRRDGAKSYCSRLLSVRGSRCTECIT